MTSSRKGVQINPQTIARVTGVLFLITYVTSIPAAFFLYPPVLDDPRYIVGAGADTSVSLGAFLELLLIIANIGTAVVLWPVAKRVNEILALGFVTARVMECAFIAVGILSLLTVHLAHREGIQSICDRSLTARITVGVSCRTVSGMLEEVQASAAVLVDFTGREEGDKHVSAIGQTTVGEGRRAK